MSKDKSILSTLTEMLVSMDSYAEYFRDNEIVENVEDEIFDSSESPYATNITYDGSELEKPISTKEKPNVANIKTESKLPVNKQNYTNKNGPEYIRKYEGDNVNWRPENESAQIIEEVLNEDFDIMREEKRNFKPKSSIGY